MLKSIGENIIVSSAKNNEYEKNGIIVKRDNYTNLIGKVISVGEKVEEINVDDMILYSESSSKKILYEKAEYYVLNKKDVLAVIWGEIWKRKLYMQMMQKWRY